VVGDVQTILRKKVKMVNIYTTTDPLR